MQTDVGKSNGSLLLCPSSSCASPDAMGHRLLACARGAVVCRARSPICARAHGSAASETNEWRAERANGPTGRCLAAAECEEVRVVGERGCDRLAEPKHLPRVGAAARTTTCSHAAVASTGVSVRLCHSVHVHALRSVTGGYSARGRWRAVSFTMARATLQPRVAPLPTRAGRAYPIPGGVPESPEYPRVPLRPREYPRVPLSTQLLARSPPDSDKRSIPMDIHSFPWTFPWTKGSMARVPTHRHAAAVPS